MVPVHNHGSEEVGAIVLDQNLKPETLDAYGRTGTLTQGGGFLRVKVNKKTRNGEASFTACVLEKEPAFA
jgi:hypothetical protein